MKKQHASNTAARINIRWQAPAMAAAGEENPAGGRELPQSSLQDICELGTGAAGTRTLAAKDGAGCNSQEMKALSIRQPWAWLIVNGHKPVENRSWPTKYTGKLLIHAGQRFEPK